MNKGRAQVSMYWFSQWFCVVFPNTWEMVHDIVPEIPNLCSQRCSSQMGMDIVDIVSVYPSGKVNPHPG